MLSKWNIDTRKWQYDQVQPLYDVVTVLRTLALTEDKLKLYNLMQVYIHISIEATIQVYLCL